MTSVFFFVKKKNYICAIKFKNNLNMRTLKNLFLFAIFGLMASNAFAQGTVKGTLLEAKTNEPLPGADVVLVGTTKGVASDFDGNFVLEVPAGTQKIKISFVGYEPKSFTVVVKDGQTTNLGKIILKPSASALGEVVIVGVADIAKERQTPVAVSTMKAAEIEERIGTKELPEVLNYTPSVYATKSGGGYGDARINVRGFDQRNTAVMINGMPVNDMENGWVYWSNWAGLADVTSAMQVQRGLGSSMLPIPSVGGTINVLTNSADKKKGGSIAATFGNDNYMKFSAAYNTGLLENGLSASVLLSRFSGDGYVDATQGEGYTWFLSIGYKVNDRHKLMFTATGAPQWHQQRYYAPRIEDYLQYGATNGEPNIKYNADWGFLDGEAYSMRRNFYHKPIASLNWDWEINDNSKINTVLYGSWGRGGGTGDVGNINYNYVYPYHGASPISSLAVRDDNGLIRFDDIYTWNSGGHVDDFGADRTPDGDGMYTNTSRSGISRRASMNSHDWYGLIMKYDRDFNENWNFIGGIDLRTYSGYHYRVVNSVLGADRYLDTYDVNNPTHYIYPEDFVDADPSWNPFVDIKGQEKIYYYTQDNVRWAGTYAQLEYKKEALSAFVQGGYSNQQFQKIDYFYYLDSDPAQKTDWISMDGYNIKGGANYNLNDQHNVFVNAGYYSKQPLFNGVFPSYHNDVNDNLHNEDVSAIEAGYGFKNEHWHVNINVYDTKWSNRYKVIYDRATRSTGQMDGITEVHKGIEVESSAKYGQVKVSGMVSIGDWYYEGDVKDVEMYDENQVLQTTKDFYLDGIKVGDAAQFTARYGVNYNPIKGLYFDVNQFFVDKLYARIDATTFTEPDNHGALRLPKYSLVDAGVTYKFPVKNVGKFTTRLTVNNVFDKHYISDSYTNRFAGDDGATGILWNGVDTGNQVYFGWGRSWNFSVKLKF